MNVFKKISEGLQLVGDIAALGQEFASGQQPDTADFSKDFLNLLEEIFKVKLDSEREAKAMVLIQDLFDLLFALRAHPGDAAHQLPPL